MAHFKITEVNLGKIKPQSQHTVKFEFDEMKRDDIAIYQDGGAWRYATETNCSCTNIEVSDSGISLMYRDKGYVGTGSQQVTVFMADPSRPTRVRNAQGQDIFNTELGYINLKISYEIVA